ncbi:hypothetical protein B0T24DRAFT_599766 [Lasiosphaeria ovina]|uniref:Uncharacterized protein n=1 Tax=Lasiosphaeria ovina TaxID=92902 RepID=A0AAE0MXS3_9PEZI|nr:hypothetical protein B0T24DRAFT_599766 [Lasiosphaeria ovina]
MNLNTPSPSMTWGSASLEGLFSSNAASKPLRVSEVRARLGIKEDSKKRRAMRRALHKKKLKQSRRSPKELRDAIRTNPMQYGCPRAFKVLAAGQDVFGQCKLHDKSFYQDEEQRLYFPAFGVPGQPVRLNNSWIKPDNVDVSADKTFFTIRAGSLALYLDFTLPNLPTGFLSTPKSSYALRLEPDAVVYAVQVSANAGAARSQDALSWDDKSPDSPWQTATWEQDTMRFAFDTIVIDGDWGDKELLNEVSFRDLLTGKALDLGLANRGLYSCDMAEIQPGNDIILNVGVRPRIIPAPPAERSNRSVKSVFPAKATFRFDELGASFVGAYALASEGDVYAVKGFVHDGVDSVRFGNEQVTFSSHLEPLKDPFLGRFLGGLKDQTALDVLGLMSLNPMQPDPQSATNSRDIVSSVADSDFHNIITYYMDDDIRKTFIQDDLITFSDPTVLAIAKDTPENAAAVSAFYKQLQTPYVVARLAQMPFDLSKSCNAVRAQAQLKDIPANSDVYARHSDLLYQYRFRCQFPVFQHYLDDQASRDYSDAMRTAAKNMKNRIATAAADLLSEGGDGQTAALNLIAAQDDIDQLCEWAIDKKLYWAFRLYDHLVSVYLPTLYDQIMDRTMSPQVCRLLKAHSCVLSLLEYNQDNTTATGKGKGRTFRVAWNNLLMLFNTSTVVPQYTDVNTHSDLFDNILKGTLERLSTTSSTAKVVATAAKNAQVLATDTETRKRLLWSFNNCRRSKKGGTTRWESFLNGFYALVQSAGWYQKLVNVTELAELFLQVTCAALLAFPMISRFPDGWASVPADKKNDILASASGVALTFVIKSAADSLRMGSMWSDVGGFAPHFKAFFGFGQVLTQAPDTGLIIQSQIVAQYNSTGPKSMHLPVATAGGGGEGSGRKRVAARGKKGVGMFIALLGFDFILIMNPADVAIMYGIMTVVCLVSMIEYAIKLHNVDDWLSKSFFSVAVAMFSFCVIAMAAGFVATTNLVTAAVALQLISDVVWPCLELAAVLAFAAIVLAIVSAFMPKPKPKPTPIQTFMNKHAAPAGLAMLHRTDIDYFNVVSHDNTHKSLNGVSFLASDPGHFLQLGLATTKDKYAIQLSATLTHLPDTCWSVCTDCQGQTTIFTYAISADGRQLAVCLTRGDGDTDGVLALPAPSENTTAAEEVRRRQQWKLNCTSEAKTESRVVGNETKSFPVLAQFEITQGTKKLALTVDDAKTDWKVRLVDCNDDITNSNWTLSLQSMGPSPFYYEVPQWTLTPESSGETLFAYFDGTASLPLAVSVSPALPRFLRLSESTDSVGAIEQAEGAAPVLMAPTVYTTTVSIDIDGKLFQQHALITISVEDQSVGPSMSSQQNVVTMAESRTSPRESSTWASARAKWTNIGEEEDPTAAYDNWIQNAPPIFKWQQDSSIPLNQHWTAMAAISRMQTSFAKYSWPGGDFQGFYFRSPVAGPPLTTKVGTDPIDYQGAAAGYVAMAIRAGDSFAADVVDTTKAQHTIDAFNTLLHDNNVNRFQEWVAWDGSAPVTGPHITKGEYIDCLTKSPWMRMRIFWASTQDGWTNASLEMFCHFLKLAALGCSDDEIGNVYTLLTVGEEGKVLKPEWFIDINPMTWRTWTAYLYPAAPETAITVSQLGISNLNKTKHSQYFSAGTVVTMTYHADTVFLDELGYYHSSSGGCCLEGSSQVLMGDGKTLKRIERIQPDDSVMSISSLDGIRQPRRVAFVSRPRRNGRSLYGYKRLPGLLFTADHPIFLSGAQIGFVDPAAALRINPLWAAFPLARIQEDELVVTSPTRQHEILFDLVLEEEEGEEEEEDGSSDGNTAIPPNYIVRNGNDEVTICSEAPNTTILPSMTCFVLAFARAIGSLSTTDNAMAFFPDGLAAGVLDYSARIRKYRGACATAAAASVAIEAATETSVETSMTLSSAVEEVLNNPQNKLTPQVLADSTEALVCSLGLSLQVVVDNGWRHVVLADGTDHRHDHHRKPRRVQVLSTHFLALTQRCCRPPGSSPQLPASYGAVVARLQGVIAASAARQGEHHGDAGFGLQIGTTTAAEKVAVRKLGGGPFMYRLRADVPIEDEDDDDDEDDEEVTIRIVIKGSHNQHHHHHHHHGHEAHDTAVLVARGLLPLNDDAAVYLPVHVSSLSGIHERALQEMAYWHVGWLVVSRGTVDEDQMGGEVHDLWRASDATCRVVERGRSGHDDGGNIGGCCEKYAELLGEAVGKDVVALLVGG